MKKALTLILTAVVLFSCVPQIFAQTEIFDVYIAQLKGQKSILDQLNKLRDTEGGSWAGRAKSQEAALTNTYNQAVTFVVATQSESNRRRTFLDALSAASGKASMTMDDLTKIEQRLSNREVSTGEQVSFVTGSEGVGIAPGSAQYSLSPTPVSTGSATAQTAVAPTTTNQQQLNWYRDPSSGANVLFIRGEQPNNWVNAGSLSDNGLNGANLVVRDRLYGSLHYYRENTVGDSKVVELLASNGKWEKTSLGTLDVVKKLSWVSNFQNLPGSVSVTGSNVPSSSLPSTDLPTLNGNVLSLNGKGYASLPSLLAENQVGVYIESGKTDKVVKYNGYLYVQQANGDIYNLGSNGKTRNLVIAPALKKDIEGMISQSNGKQVTPISPPVAQPVVSGAPAAPVTSTATTPSNVDNRMYLVTSFMGDEDKWVSGADISGNTLVEYTVVDGQLISRSRGYQDVQFFNSQTGQWQDVTATTKSTVTQFVSTAGPQYGLNSASVSALTASQPSTTRTSATPAPSLTKITVEGIDFFYDPVEYNKNKGKDFTPLYLDSGKTKKAESWITKDGGEVSRQPESGEVRNYATFPVFENRLLSWYTSSNGDSAVFVDGAQPAGWVKNKDIRTNPAAQFEVVDTITGAIRYYSKIPSTGKDNLFIMTPSGWDQTSLQNVDDLINKDHSGWSYRNLPTVPSSYNPGTEVWAKSGGSSDTYGSLYKIAAVENSTLR